MSIHEQTRTIPERTQTLRQDARARAVMIVLLASAWGLVAAWWTPRGPLTSLEAILSILISTGVGFLAGYALRSRWAMLVTPVVFAVVFEVARLGVQGPMVDGPHASFYGAIALITGRGVLALLTLLPLAFGAALGAGRTRDESGWLGRIGTVIVGLALLALVVGLARPATTAPIAGDKSVAELTTVQTGGHDLGLMIRGTNTGNPVLLFLAGGPGGSEYGAMRRHLPALEEHFTVATWDQRGAGTSYPELDPTDTISVDGYIADTIAVTDYLRERFSQDQIYLLGQSWGTTLGVMAVQERPDLYKAFIGSGQMVSQLETDRIFYQDTLAWAQQTGNDGLAQQLQSAGPPPYDRMLDYETALSHEQDVYAYDHTGNSEGSGGMSENLLVPEYTLIDQVHVIGAFMDTFAALYPQLQEVDFRETATEFEVPMFFVQGANEAGGRAQLFEQWYPMIDAPIKDVTELETSGHRPLWEQPDEFVDYMVDTVLART
jgi:pimeloyl-ACP methyl ester carboxylesterase